jgi:hypothetical protein
MTYHLVDVEKVSNPDFDGQVLIKCDCGWSSNAHETFSDAIRNRHLTLNEQNQEKGKA